MNILGNMQKLKSFGKYLLIAVLLVNFASMVTGSGAANITSALGVLCRTAQTFLGAAVMVMIVLAGLTYAIGQIMGAETRARAAVWATAMLTGAVIGLVIYLITPPIVGALVGTNVGLSASASGNPCEGL